ncbi:acetyltransferase [Penicillium angulare]|uniref:acetyltransferase n=1 Tax=Penicillium angulare TaxID=116970 RepID=UPI0025420489|nr:acetyltransferase [Penicillium angulare]KAJ5280048.1 acetyltransferase [Penicillium angulare]
MSNANHLKLEGVVSEDIHALVELWFAAFSDPHSRSLFPDTTGVKNWLQDAISRDMLEHPFQTYMKIIDTGSKDTDGKPPIAAYAKWDFSLAEERGPRYPPWHTDMPKGLCDAFVRRGENNRRRVMGNEKHLFLDIVATHPSYQRQGAATMLVKWACEQADAERLSIYVGASEDGAVFYARFGFTDYSIVGQGTVSMVRREHDQS